VLIAFSLFFGLASYTKWILSSGERARNEFLEKMEPQPVLLAALSAPERKLPPDVSELVCENLFTIGTKRMHCMARVDKGSLVESSFDSEGSELPQYSLKLIAKPKGGLAVLANIDKESMSPERARDVLLQAVEQQWELARAREMANQVAESRKASVVANKKAWADQQALAASAAK
jgi:hypothetical protein